MRSQSQRRRFLPFRLDPLFLFVALIGITIALERRPTKDPVNPHLQLRYFPKYHQNLWAEDYDGKWKPIVPPGSDSEDET